MLEFNLTCEKKRYLSRLKIIPYNNNRTTTAKMKRYILKNFTKNILEFLKQTNNVKNIFFLRNIL